MRITGSVRGGWLDAGIELLMLRNEAAIVHPYPDLGLQGVREGLGVVLMYTSSPVS